MAHAQTLRYVCLLIASALTADATETGIAYINEEAELHCKFEDLQSPSIGKVDYYWQRGSDLVNSLSDAKASIIERYRNRTIVLPNGHLRIFNVTIKDEGVYTCHRIVLNNNARQKEGDCQFHLRVIANFSVPKIEIDMDLAKPDTGPSVPELCNGTTLSYEVKNGSIVHLKCTSVNGYPKPKRLDWYLSTGNTTQDDVERIQFNNISRLYNISRRLQWKVEGDVTITCSVETQYTTVVQVLQIMVKKEIPPNVPDQKHILIICVIILILFLIVSLFLVYCNKRKHRNTGQCMYTRSTRQKGVDSEAAVKTEGRELMPEKPEEPTV